MNLLALLWSAGCGDKDVDSATFDSAPVEVDVDGDGFLVDEDCDDSDEAVNPDADELCDGIDNDCDGDIDEDDAIDAGTWYADDDEDGFGDAESSRTACEQPDEYVTDTTDCDDNDDDIHPAADEICDDEDNNCDGEINEDSAVDAPIWYVDLDGDGYGDPATAAPACEQPSGSVSDGTDCDDDVGTINPGAEELCDAADTDCDGTIGEVLVPSDHPTIQEAIDAGEPEICIEAGTYYEQLDFGGVAGVSLEGVGGPSSVTLDGSGTGRVLTLDRGETNIEISGLTLANGYVGDGDHGAAIYASGVSGLDLEDIVMQGHLAEGESFGGVFAADDYSFGITFTDVQVFDNTMSDPDGGSIYGLLAFDSSSLDADGLDIHDNLVETASGAYGSLLTISATNSEPIALNDLRVTDNEASAAWHYGAVLLRDAQQLDLTNVRIEDNVLTGTSDWMYAPLYVQTSYDTALSHVEIAGNELDASEGMLYALGWWNFNSQGPVDVRNLIVAGNRGTARTAVSAGVWESYGEDAASFTNVTVHGNELTTTDALLGGGSFTCSASALEAVNVTLSGNNVSGAGDYGGWAYSSAIPGACSWDVSYSNVWDNDSDFGVTLTDWTGTDGNIEVAPSFSDVSTSASDWDLTLDSSSALIDAGDPSISDADGSTSDIGAYGGPGSEDW